MQFLHGHVPAVVKTLSPVGRPAAASNLNLAIGLPLRNHGELSNLLQQIYDPASPNFHHYLTPEQFTERFGPTEADYQAVIAFAKANGLRVTTTHPNRVLLDVSGQVADVERALHVTMRTYRHPTENRTFFAPDTEPSLDLTVPILHISGLDNYSLPRPHFVAKPLFLEPAASPNAGSGPDGTFMGNDFRAAYLPGSTLTGSGQTVGLLQFDGYTASDITYYENQAGLTNVPLQNVLLDGFNGNPSTNNGPTEVSLDIEMTVSMAPGLAGVIVYEAPNPSPFEDILNRMVTDNLAKQLSCSWFLPNGTNDPAADQIFQQMAAQGQSFFNASGDGDAYTGLIDFPDDSPYITQVGGTTLRTTGPGGSWASETVWNWGNEFGSDYDGSGSGGGISTQYPIPNWQTNISMTASKGSVTKRNTPDVALTADNIYVRVGNDDFEIGGTSCAAPLWAGFAALVNQQAAAAGQPAIGFVNPAIYAIGIGTNYTSDFHDITTGNNTWSSSTTKFFAVSGYDLCTGWGTPAGQNLINALANPEPLLIAPATGFSASGGMSGSFTTTSQNFSLTNIGTNSLSWMLTNTTAWLNVSPTNGILTNGGSATIVNVSLNSAASNLVVGIYSAMVWFTNLNDSVGQSRQFTLSVVGPPIITRQPTNQAVVQGATAAFNVSATGGLPLSYQWQDNGTNVTDGGNISGSTTTNLIISNVSAVNIGAYAVTVTNIAGAVVSSNAFLTITSSPPVIVTQPTNQTVLAGGTASFNVIAIGSTPLSYQWSLNGTNILGATSTNIIIANVQTNNAGIYSVTVTNLYGFALSSNAMLTVTPLPSCDPSPSGMVGWWKGEGDASDSVGVNNGAMVNGAYFTNGEVGEAFDLPGVSACSRPANGPEVLVPDSSLWAFGTNSFTIELWANFNIVPNNCGFSQGNPYDGMFISNDEGSGGNQKWWFALDDGRLDFHINGPAINGGSGVFLVQAPFTPVTNQWYHMAVTRNGNLYTIYTNGVAIGSQTDTTTIPDANAPLEIGGGEGFFFNGRLDEVSIYKRALSASEILSIYNAGSGGKCPVPPTPPVITAQPTNQTVVFGQTATFSVGVTGTQPLTYQWSFSGTNIVGATNTLLTLTNVQFSQAGNYSVAVTNIIGSTNSAIAVLTVNSPPSCDSAPSGLVAWWAAEGNANDNVGTNNGALNGGVTYASGEVGQAFKFSGTNSYVAVPSSPNLKFSNTFTVEAWINYNSTGGNETIVTKGQDANTAMDWQVAIHGGHLYSDIFVSGVQSPGTFNTALVPGTWYHVAVTYDGSNLRGYVNGALDGTVGYTGTLRTTDYALRIGAYAPVSGDTEFFSGKVDELSLYNRALSSNEVAAIYNAGTGGKCPVPPTIITQPINQAVVVGGTVTFSVNAAGTQPLTYQWSFSGTNIAGATNTLLTLTNVQFSQAGNYSVAVTNIYGSVISSNGILTVNPLPPCDPAPSGLVAWWPAEGNATDIVGTNNGSPTGGITYTNGEVGQAFSFDNINTSTSYIPVPASPSLNIGTNSGFTIECWVKPDALVLHGGAPIVEWDSSSTDGLQLWVGGPSASITDTSGSIHVVQPASNMLNSNNFQHVALTYDKSSGKALLYLNGSIIASNNFGSITPQTTYPLNIGRRTGQPIGNGSNYGGLMDELSFYNRALSSSEIAAIYNSGSSGKCPVSPTPPVITAQPTNQIVFVGQTATFSVSAIGTQPLTYQWSMNATNIVGATNATLTLANVQFSQTGNYSVLVTNIIGSTNSTIAVLTVNTSPSITTQPTNLVVVRGSNATFNVIAAGSAPLIYQWNFNGTNVAAATNSSLTLTNIQLNQAGNYAVLVTNLFGSILSSNAALTVNPLFHFIWNHIPSPRFANAPFVVVVQAQNTTNGPATNFTDTVVLLSTNGIPINPAVSANFIQGVWTGAVMVAQTTTNLVLQATDSFGESGLANAINVVNLPPLAAVPSGGTLFISWPVSPSGFILETTPTLSPANWNQVSGSAFQIGNQFVQPITLSGTNGFYRLRFTGQ